MIIAGFKIIEFNSASIRSLVMDLTPQSNTFYIISYLRCLNFDNKVICNYYDFFKKQSNICCDMDK
jgi:hypothetical protein